MSGPTTGGFLLGMFAFLMGMAGIAVAIRRRRGRARYAEAYASTGGIIYTVVQVGCSGLLLIGGIAVMVLTIVFRR